MTSVRREPLIAARFRLLLLAAAALFLGFSLVAAPALGTVLTGPVGLSPTEYGALFVPQVALSVAGAMLGGGFARRAGMRRLLAAALLGIAASHALLASLAFCPPEAAFELALGAAALLGLGFGFSAAPLNSLPARLYPARAHSALVAAHCLVGLGLSLGPLAAGLLVEHGRWFLLPVLLVGLGGICLAGCLFLRLPPAAVPAEPRDGASRHRHPLSHGRFWTFTGCVLLYAASEGMFSNWAVIFLRDARALSEQSATLALSAFWVAVVLGRLLVSALVTRFSAARLWMLMPPLMAASLLAAPLTDGAASALVIFAGAGLACSAFLPLGIALAAEQFPAHAAWVSSMLVAALMTGVGAVTLVVGALLDAGWSFDVLYRLAAVAPLLALWLVLRALRGSTTLPAVAPAVGAGPAAG